MSERETDEWVDWTWTPCPCGAIPQVQPREIYDSGTFGTFGDEPARCTECGRRGAIRYVDGPAPFLARVPVIQWDDPEDARPSWDEYFMQIAETASSRSTCLRRQIGAVLVMDRRILATGYNGAPSGLAHCSEAGCIRTEQNVPSGERHELCRGLHAEENAMLQAARHGTAIDGATLYSTHVPCTMCTKMLINCGICRVVARSEYPDDLASELLEESGIPLEII